MNSSGAVQVHGVVLNQTREDCELVEGDYTLRIDLSGVTIPDTFAEDKGAPASRRRWTRSRMGWFTAPPVASGLPPPRT